MARELTTPKAFISYAWGNDAHQQWVKGLASRLRIEGGVRVTLDQWHAVPGDQPAFQERFVEAAAKGDATGVGSGVEVKGVTYGPTTGRMAFDPTNPMADANVYVKYPDIVLGEQMTQMMAAQRAYQANLATIDRAKDAYQQALELGK